MNRGDDDDETNEEKKLVASRKQFKEQQNNEPNIPELISRYDAAESSDDDSEEDTPRRREQLPIETRLEKLKEAIERISSVQRGNRMPGLQERNREDSDSESDNEEDDESNNIPRLQDRDIEDSDSEDDEEDDKDDDENVHLQQNIRTNLAKNEVDTTDDRTSPETRHTLTENEDEEDLYFESTDDEGDDDRFRHNNTNNDNEAAAISPEKRHITIENEDEPNFSGNKTSKSRSTHSENEGNILSATSDDESTNEDNDRAQPTRQKPKITKENMPFGNVCEEVVTDNDTPYIRMYCQNVSGIFDRDGIGLDSAFKEIKEASADIFTFNETHGDESNPIARRALRLSTQRMWRNNNEDCKIVHSSSTAPILSFTKPGGNLVGVTGSLVGRIRETITDPYGRWCGYTLLGRDKKEIMILTAYNVSQYKNAKVGEDTLFNQQIALYKLKNIREPDPKQIFIDDLTTLVKKARNEDKDIILTGDFNELVGDDPRGMQRVLAAGGLTDVHEHQHGPVDITTYTRGVKRLDYVFVTPRLVNHILRSGYESFHSRIASDHRGYFVDFALAGFFDRRLPSIFSASSRAIRGSHPSNITKYIEYLDAYLNNNDMYRKVKEQKNWYEKNQLEKLDRMITRGMLEAEDQCRIFHRQTWSKEVNEVMTTANILRIHLSSLKNNIDCSKQIRQKQALLKKEIELSNDIKETTIALRIAQKNRRQLINKQRTEATSMDNEQEAAYVAMNPEIDAKRAAQIFQRARDTKQMMSELPSKMNCPGGISAILVPLPKEGNDLEYEVITDGSTIETVILQRNIRHFRQAETTPLATP